LPKKVIFAESPALLEIDKVIEEVVQVDASMVCLAFFMSFFRKEPPKSINKDILD